MNFKKLIISLIFLATSFNTFSMQDANTKLEIAISENEKNQLLNLPNEILFTIFCYGLNESEDANEIAKRLAPIFSTCSKFYKMICHDYPNNQILKNLIIINLDSFQNYLGQECATKFDCTPEIRKISENLSSYELLNAGHYLIWTSIAKKIENEPLKHLDLIGSGNNDYIFEELIKICPFNSEFSNAMLGMIVVWGSTDLLEFFLKKSSRQNIKIKRLNRMLFLPLRRNEMDKVKLLISMGAALEDQDISDWINEGHQSHIIIQVKQSFQKIKQELKEAVSKTSL